MKKELPKFILVELNSKIKTTIIFIQEDFKVTNPSCLLTMCLN